MNPEWYKKAEKMFLLGKNYTEISKELNVGRKTVSNYIRKNGHDTPKKYHRNVVPKRKYSFKEDIFETIDSEEKAYWLGFLYADGCVSQFKNDIELALQEEDEKHLIKFKEFLNANYPIKTKSRKLNNKNYYQKSIRVTSPKTKQDLINKLCIPNKTLVLKYPESNIVPKIYDRHFIRGYFDGDGHIGYKNNGKQLGLEIVGTESFLSKLVSVSNIDINMYDFTPKRSVKRLSATGAKANSFFDYIYKDASVYLERKYNRYVNFAPTSSNVSSVSTNIGEA